MAGHQTENFSDISTKGGRQKMGGGKEEKDGGSKIRMAHDTKKKCTTGVVTVSKIVLFCFVPNVQLNRC